jgi:hypothetical protein
MDSGFPLAILCILSVFLVAYSIAVTKMLIEKEEIIDKFYNGQKPARVSKLLLFLTTMIGKI